MCIQGSIPLQSLLMKYIKTILLLISIAISKESFIEFNGYNWIEGLNGEKTITLLESKTPQFHLLFPKKAIARTNIVLMSLRSDSNHHIGRESIFEYGFFTLYNVSLDSAYGFWAQNLYTVNDNEPNEDLSEKEVKNQKATHKIVEQSFFSLSLPAKIPNGNYKINLHMKEKTSKTYSLLLDSLAEFQADIQSRELKPLKKYDKLPKWKATNKQQLIITSLHKPGAWLCKSIEIKSGEFQIPNTTLKEMGKGEFRILIPSTNQNFIFINNQQLFNE